MRPGEAPLPKIVHAGGFAGSTNSAIHKHENAWELVYLREGHIAQVKEEGELDMEPGSFVLHPPDTNHGDVASDDYFMYHVLVTSREPIHWPRSGQDLEGEPIGALLGMIVHEWYNGWVHREAYLRHCTSLLNILMVRCANQAEEAGLALSVVSKARGIFRRDFRHSVKMGDIATQLEVSRSTLYAHFHQVLGRTPQDVLDEIRLRHAVYLLKHSQLSVDQVAKGSGHYSSSHLNRKLRQSFQQTARQIRESHAEKERLRSS